MTAQRPTKARPARLVSLDRLNEAAALLEGSVNRRSVTALRKACDRWLTENPSNSRVAAAVSDPQQKAK